MRQTRPELGLTLLEVVIAASILVALAGTAFSVLSTGVDTYGVGVTGSEVEKHANRIVDEIAGHIARSGSTVLYPDASPPGGTSSLIFQESEGFTGGAIVWGTPARIQMETEPTDPDDGKDNDGDGLVDERQIVLITDLAQPATSRVVLVTGVRSYLEGETRNGKDDNGNGLVDEGGLSIDRVGEVWTIRLTLQRSAGNGRILTRTVETSISPRNRL